MAQEFVLDRFGIFPRSNMASFVRTSASVLPRLSVATRSVRLTSPQSVPASFALRALCAKAQVSTEERVIKAVNKYIALRTEELKNQEDPAPEKEQTLQALQQEVTVESKWKDLGFDDLDAVEVLLEVEEEFGLVIPDDESDAITSVSDTLAHLKRNNIE
uniref:Acyl carrier protein n=1 Tax=Noctiluca scintillans TaxID=2966 RepID=A0A7S1FEX9_NOCSC